MVDRRTIGPRNVLTLEESGPVVQSWVSTNPGLKFNPLFISFCISVHNCLL